MVGRSWHPGYSEEVRQAGVIGLCSGDESAQQVADRLGVSLAEIFEANRRCYGYRRMQASLARQSVMISEKVIQRLMKQEQLVVARPRRRRFGSYLGEISRKRSADGVGLEVPWHQGFDVGGRPALSDAA